jgi:hypothetical protein
MKKHNPLFLIIVFMFLTNCSPETKQSLGFVKAVPDEYRVIKHDILKIPQKSKLPKPGKPTDIKTKQQIINTTTSLLMKEGFNRKNPPHEAELAFLNKLNISGNKEIYDQLSEDAEKHALAEERWQSKIKDTVFFWKKTNKKKAKIIDAEQEIKNLEASET